jgi:hypothetical protein
MMFATLKAFNILKRQYRLEVEAVITDSGAEFGSGPAAKNKGEHPVAGMSVKHRYTGPYPLKLTGKWSGSGKPLRRILLRRPSTGTLMT